ncbi:unnamed protein product [Closterium sp. NIES-54]
MAVTEGENEQETHQEEKTGDRTQAKAKSGPTEEEEDQGDEGHIQVVTSAATAPAAAGASAAAGVATATSAAVADAATIAAAATVAATAAEAGTSSGNMGRVPQW